jgi:hypothetical protein
MYLRGEIGENPPGNVIVSLSLSILREAGTGIEPVNSGFADRGLTTWLPRRMKSRRVTLLEGMSMTAQRDRKRSANF